MNDFYMKIRLSKLHPHPENPRKDLGDLTELIESIKAKGILEPLRVIPQLDEDGDALDEYTVLIGHRRMAAAQVAELSEVPCVLNYEELSEKQQLEIMLHENMQRSGLTVFEEAHSFQQLLDFGADVEEISEKSGFSQATVRSRLEIAKLDKDKLKAVVDKAKAEERQLSLGDFAKLSKVNSIEERNRLLDAIGTENFAWKVRGAINKQKEEEFRPQVEAWVAEKNLKKMPADDRYTSKWEKLGQYSLSAWDTKVKAAEEVIKTDRQLCYYFEYGELLIFVKRQRTKTDMAQKKAPSEESKRSKKMIVEKWAELRLVATQAYNMRKEFVDKLKVTSNNREVMVMGAVYAAIYNSLSYESTDTDTLCRLLGLEPEKRYSAEAERIKKEMGCNLAWAADKNLPTLIYSLFNDNAKNTCSSNYEKELPKFTVSPRLHLLYNWLKSLGYELSSEEKQLLYGTHEVFQEEI